MTIYEILDDIKSERKKKVILDTDAFNEIDDQFAIAYTYLSEKMELLAVCAEHYKHDRQRDPAAGMEKSYDEIIKVLSLTDPAYKTPVFHGSTTSIDAVGDAVESDAAENIIRIVRESDEIVYIAAIGAITNVASAIMKAPDIKEKMCVLWLGCNQLDMADPIEYNLEQDYKAGQFLLDCGVPTVIVPACWVTSVLRSRIENTAKLKGANPVCDYLYKISEEAYIAVGRPETWARTIWDLGAPAIFENPECAEFEIVPTPILTDERKYAFDEKRHKMIIVTKLHRDPIFARAWKVLRGDV